MYRCMFHPSKPKLACSFYESVTVYSAPSHFIQFSEWQRPEPKMTLGSSGPALCMDWNVSTTLTLIHSEIKSLLFQVDGFMLAGGSRNGSLITWNEDGGDMNTFTLHNRSINCIEWNKFEGSGHLLATGSKDHVMFICTRSIYPLTFNLNIFNRLQLFGIQSQRNPQHLNLKTKFRPFAGSPSTHLLVVLLIPFTSTTSTVPHCCLSILT